RTVLLKKEPQVVSKLQLNQHLSRSGGSRSCLQTVPPNSPSGTSARNRLPSTSTAAASSPMPVCCPSACLTGNSASLPSSPDDFLITAPRSSSPTPAKPSSPRTSTKSSPAIPTATMPKRYATIRSSRPSSASPRTTTKPWPVVPRSIASTTPSHAVKPSYLW